MFAVAFWMTVPSVAAEGDPPAQPFVPSQRPGDEDESTQPLVLEWSKEGYNFWTELKAVLEQKGYADAAVLVYHAASQIDRGVMPDFHDGDLRVSFPTLIALVMRDNPPIRAAFSEQFGKLGRLRAHAAMAAGNVAAVEAAAEQFAGTDVAAESHAWLGDRRLAAGRFAEALGHYQRAAEASPDADDSSLAARIRLAGALQGRLIGSPVEGPVRLGGSQWEARKFEDWIARLRQDRAFRAWDEEAGGMAALAPPEAPPPSRYEARPFASFDAEGGWQAEGEKTRQGWGSLGGALSATVCGDLLVLASGRTLGALDLASGKKVWQLDSGEARGAPRSWRDVPVRPLLAEGRVYSRRWSQRGPELIGVDADHGKLLWTSEPKQFVVSDPLWERGRLLALTLVEEPELSRKKLKSDGRDPAKSAADRVASWQLSLSALDPQAGKTLQRWPLARLQSQGWSVPGCQTALADDRIVASVPGGVLCFDRSATVRWIRRVAAPLAAAERLSAGPLLVAEDRVYLVPTGSESVFCIDLTCGRRLWETRIPELGRLVGVVGGRLVVEDPAGLAALEIVDGRVAWRQPIEHALSGLLCGGPGQLAYTCRDAGDGEPCPALVWLDVSTGQIAARQRFVDLNLGYDSHRAVCLGPLLAAGPRIFAAYRDTSKGRKEQGLLELLRLPEPADR